MSVRSAIRQGLHLAGRASAGVWALFLANLALAAIATEPVYHGILSFSGHSLAARMLATGFSPDWLTDFSFNGAGALDRYARWIAAVGLLSIPVDAVLAGGVLARFQEADRGHKSSGYFRDCGRYAGRLLRLMLVGLILYWLVLRLLHQSLGGIINRWTADWLDDRTVFAANLGLGALVILGLVFVNLVMDYAQVRLVMDDESSAIASFLGSLGLTLKRLRTVFAVYLLPSLGGISLLLLYRLLMPWRFINSHTVNPPGRGWQEPLTLALLFAGQQAVMFGRFWFRVATWASEWSYVRAWKSQMGR